MENKLVNSVKKAFDVLDILTLGDCKGGGKSLKELSDATGILPNTLHGILKTMVYCGYAEKDGHIYKPGRRCRQIGIINRFRFNPEISNTLNSVTGRLCRRTGEGVSFYVLDNGERINYINYQSDALIRVEYTMLRENSIYDYPSGKLLAAHCSRSELDLIIKKHGYPGTLWNNASDRASLERETEKLRKQSYLKQETEGGTVTSYAAAVFADGVLLGSLGVYMPTFRVTEEKEKFIINELLKSADEINKILSRR